MKKIILGIAVASFVVSCQKIQAGSNKGVIKMEEGAERYSDIEIGSTKVMPEDAKTESVVSAVAADSTRTANIEGVTLKKDSVNAKVEAAAEPAKK